MKLKRLIFKDGREAFTTEGVEVFLGKQPPVKVEEIEHDLKDTMEFFKNIQGFQLKKEGKKIKLVKKEKEKADVIK